jgi:TolB-like protein/Tfp pilus assembly protein PilF
VPIEHIERCLAAILAADVAGYSRLTSLDEEGTHAQLQDHLRSLIDPKIAEHRGRIVKNTGDGLLAEFSSVVDAVRCAVEVQRDMAERNADVPQERRIEFRLGINVGDVMLDRGDIYGDGVNVAVRLEGIAEAGGICIAGRVLEDIQGKLDVVFEDTGEQRLKNIIRPVRVYRMRPSAAAATQRPALPLPEKPSIAVLPFKNMSGDPEQEYFADGVVEEIIIALSRFHELFVIARNSSFTYKGSDVDVKQVGRELGVRYVLKGSVRKAPNQIRIAGQLVDASTGAHLWADHFDGPLKDIFDLQDHMSACVVGAIAPKLEQAEIERARRKPTESLDAYDYYLRGRASFHRGNTKAIAEALEQFNKAIQLDPSFGSAYGMAAWCHFVFVSNWTGGPIDALEAERLARRAARLGTDDATALSTAGFVLANYAHNFDVGVALVNRALALNPNLGTVWFLSGWVRLRNGETDVAIEHFSRAQRLSPFDPLLWAMHAGTAWAHFLAGRYHEALSDVEQCLRDRPNYRPAVFLVAAISALAGAADRARRAVAHIRELEPTACISNAKERMRFYPSEQVARVIEGLRKAGLPE